jgi:hypothetical protein
MRRILHRAVSDAKGGAVEGEQFVLVENETGVCECGGEDSTAARRCICICK